MERGKVLILSDSNGRNLFSLLQHTLHGQYSVFAFIKPNAKLKDVVDSIDDLTSNFNRRDYVLIVGGTNDVSAETKYQTTITEALDNLVSVSLKTNLILTEIPQNYFRKMYKIIKEANKFMRNAIYIKYKTVVNNIDFMVLGKMFRRSDFTRHGLHMNLKGKTKLAIAFASIIRGVAITENELQLINDRMRLDMLAFESSKFSEKSEPKKIRRGRKAYKKSKIDKENSYLEVEITAIDNTHKKRYRHRREYKNLRVVKEVTNRKDTSKSLKIPTLDRTEPNEIRNVYKELRTSHSIPAKVDITTRNNVGFSEDMTQTPECVTLDMECFLNDNVLMKIEKLVEESEKPAVGRDSDNVLSESIVCSEITKSETPLLCEESRSLNIPQDCTLLSENTDTIEGLFNKVSESTIRNLERTFHVELAESKTILTCGNVKIELCLDETNNALNSEDFILDLSQVEYIIGSEDVTPELLDFIKTIHLIKVGKSIDETGDSVDGRYMGYTNDKSEITVFSEEVTPKTEVEIYQNNLNNMFTLDMSQLDCLSCPSNATHDLENFMNGSLVIEVEEIIKETGIPRGGVTIEFENNTSINNSVINSMKSHDMEITFIPNETNTERYENTLLETDKEISLDKPEIKHVSKNIETDDFINKDSHIEIEELNDQGESQTTFRNMEHKDNWSLVSMERTESKIISTDVEGEMESYTDKLDSNLNTGKLFCTDISQVECTKVSENETLILVNCTIERLLTEVEELVDERDRYNKGLDCIEETESEALSINEKLKIESKNENIEIDTNIGLNLFELTIDLNLKNKSSLTKDEDNQTKKQTNGMDDDSDLETYELSLDISQTDPIYQKVLSELTGVLNELLTKVEELFDQCESPTGRRYLKCCTDEYERNKSSGITGANDTGLIWENIKAHPIQNGILTEPEKYSEDMISTLNEAEELFDRTEIPVECDNSTCTSLVSSDSNNFETASSCDELNIEPHKCNVLHKYNNFHESVTKRFEFSEQLITDLETNVDLIDNFEEPPDNLDKYSGCSDYENCCGNVVSVETTDSEIGSTFEDVFLELDSNEHVGSKFPTIFIEVPQSDFCVAPDVEVKANMLVENEELHKDIEDLPDKREEHGYGYLVSPEITMLESDSTCEGIYVELDDDEHIGNNFEDHTVFNVGVPHSDCLTVPNKKTPQLVDYRNENLVIKFDGLLPLADSDSDNKFHLITDTYIEVNSEISDSNKENAKVDNNDIMITETESISKQIDIDFENEIDLINLNMIDVPECLYP